MLTALTDDELAQGGYRFEDLQARRIITNRTDLNRKQRELGFPLPVKTGNSQAMFLRVEVHAWLRERLALRAAPKHAGASESGAQVEAPLVHRPAARRKQPRREKAVQDVVAAPPPAPAPPPRQQPSQRDSLGSIREAARKRRGAA